MITQIVSGITLAPSWTLHQRVPITPGPSHHRGGVSGDTGGDNDTLEPL